MVVERRQAAAGGSSTDESTARLQHPEDSDG